MLHTSSIDGGFDEAFIDDNEYYFDSSNDQSWACTFGTHEEVCADLYGYKLFATSFLGIRSSCRMGYGWFAMTHQEQSCQ